VASPVLAAVAAAAVVVAVVAVVVVVWPVSLRRTQLHRIRALAMPLCTSALSCYRTAVAIIL
jgi:hypothetical protein